jgi:hypothetical protein
MTRIPPGRLPRRRAPAGSASGAEPEPRQPEGRAEEAFNGFRVCQAVHAADRAGPASAEAQRGRAGRWGPARGRRQGGIMICSPSHGQVVQAAPACAPGPAGPGWGGPSPGRRVSPSGARCQRPGGTSQPRSRVSAVRLAGYSGPDRRARVAKLGRLGPGPSRAAGRLA